MLRDIPRLWDEAWSGDPRDQVRRAKSLIAANVLSYPHRSRWVFRDPKGYWECIAVPWFSSLVRWPWRYWWLIEALTCCLRCSVPTIQHNRPWEADIREEVEVFRIWHCRPGSGGSLHVPHVHSHHSPLQQTNKSVLQTPDLWPWHPHPICKSVAISGWYYAPDATCPKSLQYRHLIRWWRSLGPGIQEFAWQQQCAPRN